MCRNVYWATIGHSAPPAAAEGPALLLLTKGIIFSSSKALDSHSHTQWCKLIAVARGTGAQPDIDRCISRGTCCTLRLLCHHCLLQPRWGEIRWGCYTSQGSCLRPMDGAQCHSIVSEVGHTGLKVGMDPKKSCCSLCSLQWQSLTLGAQGKMMWFGADTLPSVHIPLSPASALW